MSFVCLVVLILFTIASDGFGQAQRRVLLEEFTNTGSVLAAETDPMIEACEMDNFNDVIILKWHVSWPYDNDPFYTKYPNSEDRAKKLYDIEANPYVCLNGAPLGGFGVIQLYDKQTLYHEIQTEKAKQSPYEIAVTQEIFIDSIISTVTIKCVSAPVSGELRLGVAIAERYNPYTGTNGSKYTRNAVRTLLPGTSSDGAIDVSVKYPAFTIANGETKTIRYACLMNTSWRIDQLVSIAFIQDAFTNEVYNANTSLPVNINTSQDRLVFVPSDTSLNITFTNTTGSPIGIRAELSAPTIPADWNVFLSGTLSDGSFSVPAEGNKVISLRSTAANNKQGYYPLSITVLTLNDMYIGTYSGIAWGKENKDIIVDAGAGTSKTNILEAGVNASGDYKTVSIPYQTLLGHFDNWKDFRTVLIHTGNTFGIHPYDATWDIIKDFNAQGGNVLITSNDQYNLVGNYYEAIQDPNNPTDFIDLMDKQIRDNLHIEPSGFSSGSPWTVLNGIPGDELSSGFASTLSGSTGVQEFTLLDGAAATLKNENNDVVGIRVRPGNGKLVYLPFGVDNVLLQDRFAFTKRIMDWFAGVGSVKVSASSAALSIMNYPNPAREKTTVTYSIKERTPVTVRVYDMLGNERAIVVPLEIQDKGTYEAEYDVASLPSGNYILMLTSGAESISTTLTVSK
jgi:hypothetical protein